MDQKQRAWPSFNDILSQNQLDLRRSSLQTLQVNIGKLCNQSCRHCHVDAGPTKTRENMQQATAERLVELASQYRKLQTIDITGGAPELNPNFRYLVTAFRELGLKVIDRCNLTVLHQPGQESTAEFLARYGVSIVASLPCYSEDNVNQQRGDGVFEQSIRALQQLNSLGYGQPDSQLTLDLVYNPLGPNLPPNQAKLESQYHQKLKEDFGIVFNHLFTITNMPIKRFLADLRRQQQLEAYMTLLVQNFSPAAAGLVMCRTLVSVGWDGKLYDCDFNQMLSIPAAQPVGDIFSLDSLEQLCTGSIATADHCFGCTAGSGSSCGGALA